MPKGGTTVSDKVYPSRVTKMEFLVGRRHNHLHWQQRVLQLEPQMAGSHLCSHQLPWLIYSLYTIHLLLVRKTAGMSKTNKKKYRLIPFANSVSYSHTKVSWQQGNISQLTMYRFVLDLCVVNLSPILSPSMDGLNHLREQSADTFIDKILEEMYSLLIIQIQPEFLLELIDDAPQKQRTCHFDCFCRVDNLNWYNPNLPWDLHFHQRRYLECLTVPSTWTDSKWGC